MCEHANHRNLQLHVVFNLVEVDRGHVLTEQPHEEPHGDLLQPPRLEALGILRSQQACMDEGRRWILKAKQANAGAGWRRKAR